jgi:hypothetical protein
MKATHKIFLINSLATALFLTGVSGASATVGAYCNIGINPVNCDDGEFCNGTGAGGRSGGYCSTTGSQIIHNYSSHQINPSPAAPTPTCPTNSVLIGSNCISTYMISPVGNPAVDPCRGTIQPTPPQTRANVFEAFWNFITHKRRG